MNYLVLLLMIILMVGCTNAENLTITNTENAQQEVTTVDKEPEKLLPRSLKRQKEKKLPRRLLTNRHPRKHQPNQITNYSQDTNVLKWMVVICLGIVNLMSLWMLVMGTVNTGHLQTNTGN